jgi:hypothetical protein
LRLIALLLCISGIAALSRPPTVEVGAEHRPPLLPRREFLHAIGASYQQLVADYFWIQAIQAVGRAEIAEEYRDVFDYADLATDLDPTFITVYRFCGPAITFNKGREDWVNTEESTRILEKGVRAAPRDVFLRILLAYNLSYFHKQYERAARLLEETSKLQGSPRYLPALATRLYAQAGQVEAGLALARSLYETSEEPETRRNFERRIKELELERTLRNIDAAVSSFLRREGRLPSRLEELVATGDLPALPLDPLGGNLILGSDGRSSSTALARRLVVYQP